MPEPAPTRPGWALPVFAAVAAAAALGFGFLYLTRPNAGELGSVRVVVADEAGKAGGGLTVYVAEAPLVQKDTISPGQTFTGQVNFPEPYRLPPHLKLTPSGKRLYDVTAVTEFGFGWTARPLPDDIREESRKQAETADRVFGLGLSWAALQGHLKRDIVFEDFSWEAKGLRMPASQVPTKPPPPPAPFEQKGTFYTIVGQEALIPFPIPYGSPPSVELSGAYRGTTVVTDVTATGFRWKNVMKDRGGNEGELTWTARGVLPAASK